MLSFSSIKIDRWRGVSSITVAYSASKLTHMHTQHMHQMHVCRSLHQVEASCVPACCCAEGATMLLVVVQLLVDMSGGNGCCGFCCSGVFFAVQVLRLEGSQSA